MQVLALGMSRSGTESLRRALIILGYDHVYHGYDTIEDYGVIGWKPWTMLARRKFGKHGQNGDSGIGREDFDELIGHCEAVTDQPCAIFAPELIKAYPEAKVILNYRDTESWYRSGYETNARIAAWFNPLFMVLFSAGLYWNIRYTTDCFFPYFYGSLFDHGKWVYEEHSAKIRGFTPSDRLLEWTAKDGWEPLCK